MTNQLLLFAELLDMAAELLSNNPTAPPVADISVNASSLRGAVAEMQMRHADTTEDELAAIAAWADVLTAPVRLREMHSYTQLNIEQRTHTPTGRAVVIRVWCHIRPADACLLVCAAKARFHNGAVVLGVEQVRAAVARIQAKAVAT